MNNFTQDIFDNNFIYVIPSEGDIIIEEKQEAGRGLCKFRSREEVLVIKAKNKAPLIWALKNKKCAEGAFLTKNDAGLTLHIVEMKSRLDLKEFSKVVEQFKGMYYSSISVLALCDLNEITNVNLYVAFKRDLMNQLEQPIFNKILVGGGDILPIKKIWNTNQVPLTQRVVGNLVKGQRVGDDVDFGYV